jgi:GLPGLI family protein
MLKTNFIKIFLLFYSIVSFAQVKNGIIEYGASIGDDKDFDEGMLAVYFKDAKLKAKQLNYVLVFDQQKMNFSLEKGILDKSLSFAIGFVGAIGSYYKDQQSDYYLNEFDSKGIGSVILKKDRVYKWNITSESKLIMNFKCFKASTTFLFDNGTVKTTKTIIAWFCPKIPLPYGPMTFGNLPGLILELQDKNIVFGAKKINLNISDLPPIVKPFKGKIMSENQFSKIVEQYFNDKTKHNH